MSTFQTQAHGKWILAGEHSVLRGSPALVFPLKSRTLHLRHQSNGSKDLTLKLEGSHGSEMELLFWGVLERACAITGHARSTLGGVVTIDSNLPVGGGLGASAALSVGLSKMLASVNWIEKENLPEFARSLENLFHGESSGVDIAVALSNEGLHFERSGVRRPLKNVWSPKLYISYSGQRGVTKNCVDKVKALIEKNPELGARIDQDMKEAAFACEQILTTPENKGSQSQLAQAIRLAESCFERWNLIHGIPGEHRQKLLQAGARAVKPTGSGEGGYMLSLWDNEPPASLRDELIPCF